MRSEITRIDPHAIGWARATASLWGISKYHGLDEPVRLSNEVPVRLRYKNRRGQMITDRILDLKTFRTGTHVAMRMYFKNGTFTEIDIVGISDIGVLDQIATVDITS